VGSYLTIPGVVDGQELRSVQRDRDREFEIVVELSDASTDLWRASQAGSRYDLLVLTIEPSLMLALDDVYVTAASIGTDPALMAATLHAGDVRNF
jgi:hypothetical protein